MKTLRPWGFAPIPHSLSALLLRKSRLTPSGLLSGATLEKAWPKPCIGFAVLFHSLGKNEIFLKSYFMKPFSIAKRFHTSKNALRAVKTLGLCPNTSQAISALLLRKSQLRCLDFFPVLIEKARPKLYIGFAVLFHSLGKNEIYQKLIFATFNRQQYRKRSFRQIGGTVYELAQVKSV